MKRIGIIGGMSYESTLHYYEQINRLVNERAGRLVSADLVLRSVNFEEYHRLMQSGNWDEIARKLSSEALDLTLKNKCDYIAIATNTMHKVAGKVVGPHKVIDDAASHASSEINIPLVHIGDCIGEKCKEIGAKNVLLLGTKFTMSQDFMRERLSSYGLSVMDISNYAEEVEEINRIIFDELCHGVVAPESKAFMMRFVHEFPSGGRPVARPDAIILGCTELNMILEPNDTNIPLIDSTQVHIDKLAELCLSD